MYQLVACDLDGTLLRNDKTISQETLALLTKLHQDFSVIFLPSTGRSHKELPKAITSLPFVRYALTVNGGVIYDYQQQCYIYQKAIEQSLAIEVLRYVKPLPLHPSLVIAGSRYMNGDESGQIDPYIQKVAAKGVLPNATGYPDLIAAIQNQPHPVQKMLFYPDSAQDKELIITDLRQHFPQLSISSSGPFFIEINAKGIDKGVALQILCDHLQVDIAHTIAFGDAENDIPLLQQAGLAVVMANGTEPTKAVADRIAPDNQHDGVRIILEQLFYSK